MAIKDKEVLPGDVERVIDAARAVAIPADQKILHILPQEFIIDQQEGIHQPVGMSGVRLEARVHMVTGAVSAAQNIEKCVRRCGLEVDDLILEQLASSYAVLSDDEKELGVCIVDIGGGSTKFIIGERFEPQRLESLQMGCVSYSRAYFPDGKIAAAHFDRAHERAATEVTHIRKQFRSKNWAECVGSSGTLNAIAGILAARIGGKGDAVAVKTEAGE